MLDKVKEGVLFMKTHELEKELGISKHTIFYYEKEGIVTPQRDENGYRSYSQDDLQKLIMVKFLRNLNISIDDVKAILNNELDFKECLEINQLLKQNNIEYSIHGVGGCTCCGLELRQEGKSYPTDKILEVINGYLKNHWIYVQENKYQPGFLTIHSKFDKKP